MKSYLVLKDFTGTQDGLAPAEKCPAGSVKSLSDSLVAALGGTTGGYVREADVAAEEIAKAPPALANAVLDAIDEAHLETKITEPEETKPKTLTLKKK